MTKIDLFGCYEQIFKLEFQFLLPHKELKFLDFIDRHINIPSPVEHTCQVILLETLHGLTEERQHLEIYDMCACWTYSIQKRKEVERKINSQNFQKQIEMNFENHAGRATKKKGTLKLFNLLRKKVLMVIFCKELEKNK